MTDQRSGPLRLGFFTYLDGSADPAEAYRQSIELFIAADELGLDAGWVAQHHFGLSGTLPSPLLFLGAVAERTRTIDLGTAIIALPLEPALRVAEDAAVLEALHPGRLQLGFGTGAGAHGATAFGAAGVDRRAALNDGFAFLRDLFAGAALGDGTSRLHPPAADLAQRLWLGTGSLEGVAHAAAGGAGLLLSRTAWGPDSARTAELQRELIAHYRAVAATSGHRARVAVSRSVYPARDRRTALNDLEPGVLAFHARMSGGGLVSPASTPEEIFAAHNIHYGHPDEVVRSLTADAALASADELIFQVQPGQPGFDATLKALEMLATQVAPELGWRSRNHTAIERQGAAA